MFSRVVVVVIVDKENEITRMRVWLTGMQAVIRGRAYIFSSSQSSGESLIIGQASLLMGVGERHDTIRRDRKELLLVYKNPLPTPNPEMCRSVSP